MRNSIIQPGDVVEVKTPHATVWQQREFVGTDTKTGLHVCRSGIDSNDQQVYYGWDCIRQIKQKSTLIINGNSYTLTEEDYKALRALLANEEPSA